MNAGSASTETTAVRPSGIGASGGPPGRREPWSLRAQLAVASLVPAVVGLIAVVVLALYAARVTVGDEIGARLRESATAVASQLPAGLVARFQPDNARTHANLYGRLSRVAEQLGARRVFLVGLDGRSLVDTAPQAPAPGAPDRAAALDRFELEQVGRGEPASTVLYTGHDGQRYLRGYAPVVDEGVVVAALGVEGSAANYAALDRLATYLYGVGALALIALGGAVFAFARALTAPLRRLAKAAARIGGGELAAPVDTTRGAREVRVLAATMEEMRVALLTRDRELQMMLGGIAHEVRNPLGGMELFVGLLREDLADRPDERALLARVERELGQLKRIVEEFLEYARRVPLEPAPVAVAELVAEVAGLVELPVVAEVPKGAVVHADRQQLRRLLINLARNAEQAGATRVTVEGDGVTLRVRDDGPGIPSEVAARAFDAFYTTREKGTGLGLALCARIAADHGGHLRLLNPGGDGACFELRLPNRVTAE